VNSVAEDTRTMSGGGACLWTFRGDLAVGEWTMFGAATGIATRRSWELGGEKASHEHVARRTQGR
jgi:hypothetical protein